MEKRPTEAAIASRQSAIAYNPRTANVLDSLRTLSGRRPDVYRGPVPPAGGRAAALETLGGRYGDNAEHVEASIIEEAKRRKAAISTAGFTDVKEFVQIISLAPTMFQAKEEIKAEPITA